MRITKILVCVLTVSLSTGLLADETNSTLVREDALWLHIPSIDYLDNPGHFQNAYFKMEPDGSWALISYETGVPVLSLSGVEVIQTAETPMQVFLEIKGTFSNGCAELGETDVSFVEDNFTVGMYYSEESIHPEEPTDCTDEVRPFSELVQLPVYGLEAGNYTVRINDVLTDTFTILEKNVLPE